MCREEVGRPIRFCTRFCRRSARWSEPVENLATTSLTAKSRTSATQSTHNGPDKVLPSWRNSAYDWLIIPPLLHAKGLGSP